jgi:hypothetical protein
MRSYLVSTCATLTWLGSVPRARSRVSGAKTRAPHYFLCPTTMNRLLAFRLARRSQLTRQLVRTASSSSGVTAATSPQPARHGHLPGDPSSAITTQMHFFNSVLESNSIPTYRVLDGNGVVINGAEVPEVSTRTASGGEYLPNLPVD